MGKRPQARFGDKISACAGAGKVAGDTRTDGDGCVTCGCKSGSRKKSDAVNRNAVDLRRGGGVVCPIWEEVPDTRTRAIAAF